MGCRHGYSLNFIIEYCPLSFHNKEYREHRAEILLSKEKSLLPATQPLATEYMTNKNRQKEITELTRLIVGLKKEIAQLKIKRQKLELDRRFGVQNVEKKVFTIPCPLGSCRGFLSSEWKCGICDKSICKHCRVELVEGHECDKDTVESIKTIVAETRPCPRCGAPIYKINGCNQVWCTVETCHTAFDWKTGKIETVVHNPHYYEYMRAHGGMPRAEGDLRQCDMLPTADALFTTLDKLRVVDKVDVYIIHQKTRHIQQVVLRDFRNDNSEEALRKLRIKFLVGEIDEAGWKQSIKKISKQKEFNLEVSQVYEMYVRTIGDILRNVLITLNQDEAIKQAHDVRIYMNEHIIKIRNSFKMKAFTYDHYWYAVYR